MKIINIILTIFLSANAFGQKLPSKEGCIEISKASYHYLHNKKDEQTKKTSNKANRPYHLLYLDSLGNVLEEIGYGKHHNADLRLLDFIIQNKFENDKIISSIKYNTDYNKDISADYKTEYLYNKANQLAQEKELHYKTDSLFMQFDYEYDIHGNKTKIIFSPTHYYQRIFNNQSKIISLQQIYESKLRWEWTYTFTDTTRIGEFKTFYNDGDDYTKKEIKIYQNGKLSEVEEKYTSREGLSIKKKMHYDELGLLIRIDFFEAYSNSMGYKPQGFTKIKTKFCTELTAEIIEKINDMIYDEEK